MGKEREEIENERDSESVYALVCERERVHKGVSVQWKQRESMKKQ